jgi:hypothetical protein
MNDESSIGLRERRSQTRHEFWQDRVGRRSVTPKPGLEVFKNARSPRLESKWRRKLGMNSDEPNQIKVNQTKSNLRDLVKSSTRLCQDPCAAAVQGSRLKDLKRRPPIGLIALRGRAEEAGSNPVKASQTKMRTQMSRGRGRSRSQ